MLLAINTVAGIGALVGVLMVGFLLGGLFVLFLLL